MASKSFTCLISLIPHNDLVLISQVRRLRLREGKSFLQDHSARIWLSQDQNPGLLAPNMWTAIYTIISLSRAICGGDIYICVRVIYIHTHIYI